MTPAPPPWLPLLATCLNATRDQVSANGMHVTTTYAVVPERRHDLITALADLVQFLVTGSAEAADPASWRSGGRVARATWARHLSTDARGVNAVMKGTLGEAIAWWHEGQQPEVVYCQRPHLGVSQPFIDSLSILGCDPDQVLRGVQAKMTAGLPRGRVHEAFGTFEQLQRGERDDFLAETIRRLRAELDQATGLTIDLEAASTGTAMRHFHTFVCFGRQPPTDPAHDYHPRLNAHAHHGRSIALLMDNDIDGLARDVADLIRTRVLS